MEKKKIIAIYAAALILGTILVPCINAKSVEINNVEINNENDDYLELEKYFKDIEKRFNSCDSDEEKIEIISDGIVEVDKYGLLPEGLSVEEAQEFAINCYKDSKTKKTIKYLTREKTSTILKLKDILIRSLMKDSPVIKKLSNYLTHANSKCKNIETIYTNFCVGSIKNLERGTEIRWPDWMEIDYISFNAKLCLTPYGIYRNGENLKMYTPLGIVKDNFVFVIGRKRPFP